jgi:hypothetical protein
MFRGCLSPSPGGTTVCTQQLVLIIVFRRLSVFLVEQSKQDNRQLPKKIISTNCCIHTAVPPDDGPRYARNMKRLTKYTTNKLCIKLVSLYNNYLEMHGQQNIKRVEALPTHRLTETASMATVNLLLKPMEAPPLFSTRHLYSSGHRQWHSTWCCAPSWLFHRVRAGHRLWWTCTGLQGTALLQNSLSKNKSTATLNSMTTYSTGRQ